MSFPACVSMVRSGFSRRGGWVGGSVRGGQRVILTGRWDPVSADLMFFRTVLGVSTHRKGGAQPQRQQQHNPGTPVAVATWACPKMPSGHTRRVSVLPVYLHACWYFISDNFQLAVSHDGQKLLEKSMMGCKSTCLHHQSESV